MNKLKYLIVTVFIIFLSSCGDFEEVVDFRKVEDPNITKKGIIGGDYSSINWLKGTEKAMSDLLNRSITMSEGSSDNYKDTGTYFHSTDKLGIDLFSPNINILQANIAMLRKMALVGLNEIGPADKKFSKKTNAEFHFFEGISYLYAGMYFSYLPQTGGGIPVSSEVNYKSAIKAFDEAIKLNNKPEYQLAKARASYFLGDKQKALTAAKNALAKSNNFKRQAEYDLGNNLVAKAIYGRKTRDFQPLPSLDFLDPKYSKDIGKDPTVAYLKAEEAYLIIAEIEHSNGSVSGFKSTLTNLLKLVDSREVNAVNEISEERKKKNTDEQRPNKKDIIVDGRKGLVLTRSAATLVSSVSGTSLKKSDISSLGIDDNSLKVLYRTRQEIFMAEGIRLVDMGVKYVLSHTEISQNSNVQVGDNGTKPVIPSFINAIKTELDDFSYDIGAKIVTIKHDVNKILVDNKTSDLVLPFH